MRLVLGFFVLALVAGCGADGEPIPPTRSEVSLLTVFETESPEQP